MKKSKTIITAGPVLILLFSFLNMSGNSNSCGGSNSGQTTSKSSQTQTTSTQTTTKSTQTTKKSTQTTKKSTQTKPKTTQKTTPAEPVNKPKDTTEAVTIGTQTWAVANLTVSTFQNGDSIPEAKTNQEWVEAGKSEKPAWCYYNNDPKTGLKYGKLYNWFAVNDPRGLALAGWKMASDADWVQLVNSVGGQSLAGTRMKTTTGWSEGNHGTNESGFTGLPGGYRVENGTFVNLGSIGTWWSTTESKTFEATDFYLSLSGSLSRGSTPKQRGESVRCIRK